MREIKLIFTGVNAYVFPELTSPPSPLDVVFPNATRLGNSPQISPQACPQCSPPEEPSVFLPPHFPTVWGYCCDQLVYLQYFHWERLEVRGFNKKKGKEEKGHGLAELRARSPVPSEELDRLLAIPADSVAAEPPPEIWPLISGQVKIFSGGVDTNVGPCYKLLSWKNGGNLPRQSLLHQVEVEIAVSDRIDLTLVDIFDNEKSRHLPAPPDKVDNLFIGNVCAQDILGWPVNDGNNKVDGDFEWMGALTELNGSYPQVSKGQCGLKDTAEVNSDLRKKIRERLEGKAGGGGCGCECVGCQVRLN